MVCTYLLTQGLGKDFLNLEADTITPSDGNSWVQVVGLGGCDREGLVLLLDREIDRNQ